jgi:hypothetical protein
MNKKHLASIERNRAKRLAREAKEQETKVAKVAWKDSFNNKPLTDRADEILQREVDDVAFDNAVERFLGNAGKYIPRALTIKMYQDDWISNGLAMFGIDCTSRYTGMSMFQAYWHRDLYGKAISYLRQNTEIPVK